MGLAGKQLGQKLRVRTRLGSHASHPRLKEDDRDGNEETAQKVHGRLDDNGSDE